MLHGWTFQSLLWAVLALTSLLTFVPAHAEQERRPVFIVPGILGSVLKEDDAVVWGDLKSLNKERFQKLDLLPPKGAPPRLVAAKALKNIPLLFGLFEYSVYDRLIGFLEDEGGYQEGTDLFVFAYDWRRTNFSTAKRLNDFINARAPTGGYDLIAHSMGGLVTRIMLDGREPNWICTGADADASGLGPVSNADRALLCNTLYGPDRPLSWPNDEFSGPHDAASRLHTFIEMGVPHLGSVDVVDTYLSGWGALSRLLAGGPRAIQTVLLSMSSPIELAPVYKQCCFRGAKGGKNNEELPDHLDYSLWSRDVLGFGLDPCPYVRCDLRRRILAAGLSARATINDVVENGVPSTVKAHYVIVGRDVKNTNEAYYVPKTTSGDGEGVTYFVTSDGDGTVSRASALAPEPEGSVFHLVAVRTSHSLIYDDPGVLEQLKWMILRPLKAPIKARSDDLLKVAGTSIQSIGIEVDPQIAVPGDEITIALPMTARGQERFSEARFDDASIQATLIDVATDSVASTATLELDMAESFLARGEAVLTGQLIAPQEPSVYRVEVAQNDAPIRQSQLHVIPND